jgi:hypothetical protein
VATALLSTSHPLTPASVSVKEADGTISERFPVDPTEPILLGLITDIFQQYWDRVHFGTCVQGGVWEIAIDEAPQSIGMLDGYVTVDFGRWHCHLCIGEHKGTKGNPVAPELARRRRTSRAEFYRQLKQDGTPNSWGFRMFNGRDEVQMTVFFPNPYLSRDQKIRREPDWNALEMWDDLRRRYAGLEPDPKDRSSRRFVHG